MRNFIGLAPFALATLASSILGPTATAQCVASADGSGTQVQTLYAGQTINAGSVVLQVTGDNLEVTYATSAGWELEEVHTWIGPSVSQMPQTRKGNPKVGQFPYASGDVTGTTTYTLAIPLMNLGIDCDGADPSGDMALHVAAHAALRKADGTGGYTYETGWAEGSRFVEKGMWGTHFSVVLTCDCASCEHSQESCETAWTYGGPGAATCFLDIDTDCDGNMDANGQPAPEFNSWGWTNSYLAVDGPELVWPLWAGACDCDTGQGWQVGEVRVHYDSTYEKVVLWYRTYAPYILTETQSYVGGEILCRDVNGDFTVAPAQFPIFENQWSSTDKFVAFLEIEPGTELYIAARATVCIP